MIQARQPETADFNDEKLYWLFLKMPSDPMIVAVLQAIVDSNLHQQKFEFLIYLQAKTVRMLLGKIERSTQNVLDKVQSPAFAEKNNQCALSLMQTFLIGYQIDPDIFLKHIE